MIIFLSQIFDCMSVYSIWKIAGNVVMLTENRVGTITKKLMILTTILNPILKFLYENRKHDCIFFALYRNVFS